MDNWRRLGAGAAALVLAVVAVSVVNGQGTQSQNAVTPGEFVVEPPTLENLGFEWYVNGDANHNATVEVTYRKSGARSWTKGMNLLRIQNEVNPWAGATQQGVYTAPNMFAGSVLDLEPDTSYDVAFTMKDPDGVAGDPFKQVTVHTRPEPVPSREGNVYDVYPFGSGHGGRTAFTGLLAAYYECTALAGLGSACPPRVKPGDTIRVHAGTYPNDPLHYPGMPFDGTYYLTAKGTAEKPITIIAAGDGPVIFDGGGNHNVFNVMAADYHLFKDITVQNTELGFLAGVKDIAGATGLTILHSTIQNVGFGIWNEFAHSKNFYIADNTLIGRDDPDHLFGWFAAPTLDTGAPSWSTIWNEFPDQTTTYPAPIAGPPRGTYLGIKVYGSGNVVAYNSVSQFHDGIDIDTHGLPEGYPDPTAGPSLIQRENMPVANDFYNNYITHTPDNCMEADGSLHNMRQMRNLCFNQAGQVTSSQPTFAGPTYFIRNVSYNSWIGVIKWEYAEGSLYYNNTFTGRLGGLTSGGSTQGSNAQFYNNLVLGHNPGEELVEIGTFTNYTALDYNGYRPNDNATNNFEFDSPPFGTAADYTVADLVKRQYPTLAAYQAGTGQDKHSILIDWNVFAAATAPSYTDYTAIYEPSQVDLTLAPHSAAIDAGMVIPNVTDGFTGKAPDLGAYEFGKPIPHYGPRY
jgi:hypothetical protein